MHHLHDLIRTHVWNWVTCVWEWRLIPYETWVGMRHLVAVLIVACSGGPLTPAVVIPPPAPITPFPPAWGYRHPASPESWYPGRSGVPSDLGGPLDFGGEPSIAPDFGATGGSPPNNGPGDFPLTPSIPPVTVIMPPIRPVSEPDIGIALFVMGTGFVAFLRKRSSL